MTDVRLTATTTDGEVVPVLSNTKGELLLEAPIAPPEFDGNLDGDLTVSGSAIFASTQAAFTSNGSLYFREGGGAAPGSNKALINASDGTADFAGGLIKLKVDGSATFVGAGTFAGGNVELYAAGADAGAIKFLSNSGGTLRSKFQGTTAETGIYSYANSPIKFNVGSSAEDLALTIASDLSATFAGTVTVSQNINGLKAISASGTSSDSAIRVYSDTLSTYTTDLNADGSAKFSGEVTIGSKGSAWLIRESNGVAMLIEQTRRQPRTKVRDLPRELDLIEEALNEIMEKLKMTPPSGWEVWDGSDNS